MSGIIWVSGIFLDVRSFVGGRDFLSQGGYQGLGVRRVSRGGVWWSRVRGEKG